MKQYALNAKKREHKGRNQANKLKKVAMIPGVLYGKDKYNILLQIDAKEINDIFAKNGEHVAVNLMMDGVEIPTIVKEVQRDAVKREVIHIDFQPVALHEIIHAEIPILVLNGERLEKKGGVINRQISQLEVEGEVEMIPPHITIDASKLKIGDVIKVSDLEIAKELTFDRDMNEVVLSIRSHKEEAVDSVIERIEPVLINQTDKAAQ